MLLIQESRYATSILMQHNKTVSDCQQLEQADDENVLYNIGPHTDYCREINISNL